LAAILYTVSRYLSIKLVLLRILAPQAFVLQVLADSRCGGYPIPADLPGLQSTVLCEAPEMGIAQARKDRCLLKGDKVIPLQ